MKLKKNQQQIYYFELIVLLAMLSSLGALTIDLQLPAMPEILNSFGLQEANLQQWIVSAYMLGFASVQILYGPISDSVGRKPVVLFGLVIYIAASFWLMVADDYWVFLLARALQGVGAAAARIMINAITRDFFKGDEMAKVTSLVMLIFILVPVFAPTVGSLLLWLGHWHLILYVFLGFGLAVFLWTWLRLPESLAPHHKKPLRLSRLKASFIQVVTEPLAIVFAVVSGVIFSGFMAYLNSAEQIFADLYGVPEKFPYIFGLLALFFGLAAFINSRVVMRFGAMRVTLYALIALVVINVIHIGLMFAYSGLAPLWVFVAAVALINMCVGLVFGNVMAIAMMPLGDVAGMGASVIGSISTFLAAVIGIAISQQLDGNLWPIALGFFGTAIISLGLVFRYKNAVPNKRNLVT
ncbi:multidrug effflux MFS transporter [Marinicella gelatinilytica]|uniref:multidrug effflux MFS transporter n=1 Tax=Marinicella gelatinilytica TaxID=2996017 RepID=UPI0022609C79|nr:multidrug effflux MFS transporter [Marinicella gelatinilytica]MCX7544221.1 multidrug effflux MFS transporter [Marinicella gelatinilytica]